MSNSDEAVLEVMARAFATEPIAVPGDLIAALVTMSNEQLANIVHDIVMEAFSDKTSGSVIAMQAILHEVGHRIVHNMRT